LTTVKNFIITSRKMNKIINDIHIIMRLNVLLLLIILLPSCVTLTDDNGRPGFMSPNTLFLRNLPQGDDNYSMGFRDGCYNFMGQNGFGLLRMYDRPLRVEDNLLTDNLYQQGYRHGDRYCGVYVHKGIIL